MSSDSQTPVASTAPITSTEPVAAPETETLKNDFLAPKFAALTRKEKEVRQKEAALKAQQAQIEKMKSDLESKSKSSQEQEAQLLQELKSNPLKFMEKYGLTFDQLTQMQLNDQNPTPEMQMQRMRDELKAEMEEKYGNLEKTIKEKEEQAQREAEEAAISQYKSELSSFVSKDPEKYELILANDATDLMYEVADSFYKQTGEVPTYERVATAVEQHLEEQANAIFKLKKFSTARSEAKPEPQAQKTAPTLSNTLAAEVPQSGVKQMSVEESKKRAAQMLRWNS